MNLGELAERFNSNDLGGIDVFFPRLEDRDREGIRLDYSDNSDGTVLVFVGSCMAFSDRLLRTVEHEFGEIEALRVRDIPGLDGLDEPVKHSTKLVIYDEANMEALLNSRTIPKQLSNNVDHVLAYVSAVVAQDLQKQALLSKMVLQIRFLPMKAPLDAWLAALNLLILDEFFVPAELLERSTHKDAIPNRPGELDSVTKAETPEKSIPLSNLTHREIQVLELVADGLPNKLIADKLSLSEHTVKLHVHHVFGKLGVQNRASATNWYLSRNSRMKELDVQVKHDNR